MSYIRNKVEFSIITVTYNSKKTLEKTILSVLGQSYKDYEYIIIDGKSTDGTADVILQYKHALSTWVSEKDQGIYDAMNKGIRIASGKWILFMNSGDLFVDSHVLQMVADEIATDNATDILYGDILIEKRGSLTIKPAAEPCNKQRMYFCHQSAFTRTKILKTMPFDTHFKMSADLHFFKRCYYKGLRFKHIKQPVAIFDRNGISNTNRLAGLLDNVSVVKAIDVTPQKEFFLLRLYFVIIRIRVSNFFKHYKS
ncbi:MAG: glycosyltransferase family 2 protein [Tannerellaceae bacterium]